MKDYEPGAGAPLKEEKIGEFCGLNFVACEKFPADLRDVGRRIVAKDESADGGAVMEAYQMPNGGDVYVTRIFSFSTTPQAKAKP